MDGSRHWREYRGLDESLTRRSSPFGKTLNQFSWSAIMITKEFVKRKLQGALTQSIRFTEMIPMILVVKIFVDPWWLSSWVDDRSTVIVPILHSIQRILKENQDCANSQCETSSTRQPLTFSQTIRSNDYFRVRISKLLKGDPSRPRQQAFRQKIIDELFRKFEESETNKRVTCLEYWKGILTGKIFRVLKFDDRLGARTFHGKRKVCLEPAVQESWIRIGSLGGSRNLELLS